MSKTNIRERVGVDLAQQELSIPYKYRVQFTLVNIEKVILENILLL